MVVCQDRFGVEKPYPLYDLKWKLLNIDYLLT